MKYPVARRRNGLFRIDKEIVYLPKALNKTPYG